MQREAARAAGLAAALSVLNYCVWWAWDQHPAAVGSGHWYADWQGYGLLAGFVAIGIVLGWLGHPVTAAAAAATVVPGVVALGAAKLLRGNH